jgi:hypothetical protein
MWLWKLGQVIIKACLHSTGHNFGLIFTFIIVGSWFLSWICHIALWVKELWPLKVLKLRLHPLTLATIEQLFTGEQPGVLWSLLFEVITLYRATLIMERNNCHWRLLYQGVLNFRWVILFVYYRDGNKYTILVIMKLEYSDNLPS